MPQNMMGKRVGGHYPRFVSKLDKTTHVTLESERNDAEPKKPDAPRIPDFLAGWKGWSKDAR